MSHLVRIAAVLAAVVIAGCSASADVVQKTTFAATESSSLWSEMHAAIPAARVQGNVFEYN